MKHETMKILFVIKKSSLLKNGEAPIVVRVTINGVSDEVRIQRSVLPRMWNQARGCCKGRDSSKKTSIYQRTHKINL